MTHDAFIIEQLKRARAERGIKINDLAGRVDMTPEMLSRSLLGRRVLKADELVRLCVVLGIPLNRLIPRWMMPANGAEKPSA